MINININGQDISIDIADTITVTVNGQTAAFPLHTQEEHPEPVSSNLIKIEKTESVSEFFPQNDEVNESTVHEFELFTKDTLRCINREKVESLIEDQYPTREAGRQTSSTTKEQFAQAACIIAANILKAFANQQYLRYGKRIQFQHHDFYKLNRRQYDKLADLFVNAGLIRMVKQGYSLGQNAQSSLWEVSSNILNLAEDNHEKLLANHEVLITKDFLGNAGVMTDEEEQEHAPLTRQRLSAIAPEFLKRINIPSVPPYRSFNDNGNLGGRVYCGTIQQMPKQARQDILKIDNQPTVEVDFRASHLQLLSKLITGKWIDIADPYAFNLPNGQKADRKKCKEFFTRAPNATNVHGAMKKAGWTTDDYSLYKEGFKAAYPEIAEWFGTKAGCFLQKIEGDILETLMYEYFTKHNEILIPMHDAVICRQGIEDQVAQDMHRIRDEIVATYSLDDMRNALQLHHDVSQALNFEKNEQKKQKEKEAEETSFVSDEEEGFVTIQSIKAIETKQNHDLVTAKVSTKEPKIITEDMKTKGKAKLKQKADHIGEVVMKTSEEIDTMMFEERIEDTEDGRVFFELLETRLVVVKGLKPMLAGRIINDLKNGDMKTINTLWKEDCKAIDDMKKPQWFL